MIKKMLYFGNKVYLSLKLDQLLVNYLDGEREDAKVAIEDIAYIILDHYQITISHRLLSKLSEKNVALITTDDKHLPQAMFLNLNVNSLQGERSRIQLSASKPLMKNLWKQTVQAKITNQARLLESIKQKTGNLYQLANSTASGDHKNNEAKAAAFYWKSIFKMYIPRFKRGRELAYPNNLLNYGYMILRAIIARSLVGTGLLPVLGIHHHNKYNAYPLADDIMEPYRPYVDKLVLELMKNFSDNRELSSGIKKELLKLPFIDVRIRNKSRPLMIACQKTCYSLFECYKKTRKKISYPIYD